MIALLSIISILLLIYLVSLVRRLTEQPQMMNPTTKQHQQLIQKFKEINDSQSQMEKRLQDANHRINQNLSHNNEKVLERYSQFERIIQQSLLSHGDRLGEQLNRNFEVLTKGVDENLTRINDRVNQRLDESFNKTNQTFQNVISRLAKIDEAQRNIETLSTDIVSLQSILTDKKSRGAFGEIQLYQILNAIFGEEREGITYKKQVPVSTGNIVDAMLYAPDPVGNIGIDSKFPLENYQKMTDRTLSDTERKQAESQFKQDIKKHINAIAGKYIIPGETAQQAIMFLPAEAVFSELHSYHYDLIEEAQRKNVWIASPTTLMALLTTMQILQTQIEREKNTKTILEELDKLKIEFERYRTRWDALNKDMDRVTEDMKQIHITTNKINRQFTRVSEGKRLSEPSEDLTLIEQMN